MKGIHHLRQVYFLGIGGIGMSALARYFNHLGLRVAGYDRTPTRLTEALESEGMALHYNDLHSGVEALAGDPENSLVIVTPAVPAGFGEWEWLRDHGYSILKRSEVLGMICRERKCVAVAGTHGKTTVSAMTATILKNGATGCGAFLGGIAKNFNSNLVLPGPADEWLVAEADEYDRSFLQLNPDVAVITYTDPDHLDIYNDPENVRESYRLFAGLIRPGGALVVRKEIAGDFTLAGVDSYTYTLEGEADFCCRELETDPATGCFRFRLRTPWETTGIIRMVYPGILNVQNAVAAGAAARLCGATPAEIESGLGAFTGVKRRFDILLHTAGCLYIDDYAHHPEELKSFITSVRLFCPGRKITGIFQPHLYSRTRDFAREFARSLDLLDTALLLPLYPARELPLEGVSSELILNHMTLPERRLTGKQELLALLALEKPEVLLTMGAGDIDQLTGDIVEVLSDEKDNR